MDKITVPVSEKYNLTINEAAVYFNIGVKRLRRLVSENPGKFTIRCGSKQLIIKHKFEKFVDETQTI